MIILVPPSNLHIKMAEVISLANCLLHRTPYRLWEDVEVAAQSRQIGGINAACRVFPGEKQHVAKNIPQPKGKSSRKTFGETLMRRCVLFLLRRFHRVLFLSTLGFSADPKARKAYYTYDSITGGETSRCIGKKPMTMPNCWGGT